MILKKVKFKNIYIGDIYKKEEVVEREMKKIISNPFVSLHKENVLLLQLCDHAFINIDDLKSYFVYLSLARLIIDEDKFSFGDKILSDIYNPLGDVDYFVYNLSLVQPEVEDLSYKDIKKLRKT